MFRLEIYLCKYSGYLIVGVGVNKCSVWSAHTSQAGKRGGVAVSLDSISHYSKNFNGLLT